jgi:uncharacterized protein YgiM (DUF1202 family)
MSAPAFERPWRRSGALCVAIGSLACALTVDAQTPARTSAPAPIERLVDGRYSIQVDVETVDVHTEPSLRSRVIASLQIGTRVEADARQGNWYRIALLDGRPGGSRLS